MTVAYLASVPVRLLGDFEPSVDGDPTEPVSARFDGVAEKPALDSLRELVASKDRRYTYGRIVGVLEPIWIQNRPEVFGYYLFQRVSVSASHMQQLKGWMSFSLDCVYVPWDQLVVIRSARARTNDFGLTPQSLVVQPLWGETKSGEPFEVDPGGTAFSREYDHRTEYDAANLAAFHVPGSLWDEGTWDDPDAVWGGVLPGRRLRIHAGSVT